MRRSSFAWITMMLLAASGADAFAASTQIMMFNLEPGASYQVRRNGSGVGERVADRVGNLVVLTNASPGDRFEFLGGDNTQGPTPPGNVKVTESSFGCASVTWNRSSDVAVEGYRVYFGTRPRTQAAYTDSIEAGDAASASRCGLTQGNYYFAVRAYTGEGDMSAYSKEVSLSARGIDTVAPSISQRTPAAGASDVPLNATIYFVAIDDKTGVDGSGIEITVDGNDCAFTTSTTSGGLAVQCDPAGQFQADADVAVTLSVPDRATPPNVASITYHFHTGASAVDDNDVPAVAAVRPVAGGKSSDTRPTIEVRLRDHGLGVDLGSVTMEVDGNPVSFTVQGGPSDLRIRYRPSTAWPVGETVDVRVVACDRASNCAEAVSYQFTVAAAPDVAQGQGAIVPDGYWANDPARQLEVRDLPRNWCVRIFDTSGSAVCFHQNPTDGTTWLWNFRNDNGEPVAPALYLVRVSDPSGTVQRSGRFLVQSGR